MCFMKYLLIILASLSWINILAQEAEVWNSNFEEAMLKAEQQNKEILLVFTGSDWCSVCIRLERDVLNKPTFLDYVKTRYILYNADFPAKKSNKLSKETQAQNEVLAEKYNKKGIFPKGVVIASDGTYKETLFWSYKTLDQMMDIFYSLKE